MPLASTERGQCMSYVKLIGKKIPSFILAKRKSAQKEQSFYVYSRSYCTLNQKLQINIKNSVKFKKSAGMRKK